MHVILVSGWGKPDLLWRRYQKWFDSEGITTSVLQSKYNNFGPIQSAAKQLARQVNDLKYPPVLVGHSSGGLIIRYYAARYLPQSQTDVAGVVSIASPLYGAPIAKLAPWSASACQMVPGSNFLNAFDSYQEPEMPWMSVRCSRDLITPGLTTMFRAPNSIDIEANTGHNPALWNGGVWSEVRDFVIDCASGTFENILEEVEEVTDDDE